MQVLLVSPTLRGLLATVRVQVCVHLPHGLVHACAHIVARPNDLCVFGGKGGKVSQKAVMAMHSRVKVQAAE